MSLPFSFRQILLGDTQYLPTKEEQVAEWKRYAHEELAATSDFPQLARSSSPESVCC